MKKRKPTPVEKAIAQLKDMAETIEADWLNDDTTAEQNVILMVAAQNIFSAARMLDVFLRLDPPLDP